MEMTSVDGHVDLISAINLPFDFIFFLNKNTHIMLELHFKGHTSLTTECKKKKM